MDSLPKTVTRQRRDCDLNPGPSAPESSTLITRLPSHPIPNLDNPNRKQNTGKGKHKRKRSSAVSNTPNGYEKWNSHGIWDHTEVTFPPYPQPKVVGLLDLATPEGCKAELT